MPDLKKTIEDNDYEMISIAICNELIKHGFPVDKIDNLMIQILKLPTHYKFKSYILEKEKENAKCQVCGSNENLTIHHIKPVAKFPDLLYNEENVCLLCDTCHKLIHLDGNTSKVKKKLKGKVRQIFNSNLEQNLKRRNILERKI